MSTGRLCVCVGMGVGVVGVRMGVAARELWPGVYSIGQLG